MVAEHPTPRYPELPEGKLAKVRAAVVNARVLAEVADELGLGDVLLLGRGEEASGGRTKASHPRRRLEAVIGAVYLDAGWARRPTLARAAPRSASASPRRPTTPDDFDHKSRLQELPCATAPGTPALRGRRARARPRAALPGAEVSSAGESASGQPGEGPSKKDAEQAAARAWPARRSGAMPELPEVETLRQDLAKEVVGQARSRRWRSTNGTLGAPARRAPRQFRALLEGRTIRSVGRLGKYLLIGLDSGDTLVVHLGMSGQLLRVKSAKEPKPKHTHVVIAFTQGGELRYVDPRTFGELFVSIARPRPSPTGSPARPRPRSGPATARPSASTCPSSPTSASTRSRT